MFNNNLNKDKLCQIEQKYTTVWKSCQVHSITVLTQEVDWVENYRLASNINNNDILIKNLIKRLNNAKFTTWPRLVVSSNTFSCYDNMTDLLQFSERNGWLFLSIMWIELWAPRTFLHIRLHTSACLCDLVSLLVQRQDASN